MFYVNAFNKEDYKGVSMDGIKGSLLVGILLAELAFGALYNWFTSESERRGWIDGFTSLYVVVGVAVTVVLMAPLIGWRDVGLLALAFAASGVSMVTGSVGRYIHHREQEQRSIHAAMEGSEPDGDA